MNTMDTFSQYHDLISVIIAALEARDIYTAYHSERVADMSVQTAKKLGLTEKEINLVHISAHLHDIGKIGIADNVLYKPGRLTDEEFEIIKTHTTIGWSILHKVQIFDPVANIVLHHHERWDGNGYPEKLKGEEIPLLSRIIAVTDSIDAMLSNRSYRKSMNSERCKMEIAENAGIMYQSEIARAALQIWESLVESRNDFYN